MHIPDYEALARQALDTCLNIKPGNRVWIDTWDHDIQLASKLATECVNRQCSTFTTTRFEDAWGRDIIEAPIEQIENLPSQLAAALAQTDVYIFTLGPKIIPWEKIPAERRRLVTMWFLEQNKFVEQWKVIAKARKVKMLGIEATLATPEKGQGSRLEL